MSKVKTIKGTFIHDPGHGWLSVTHKDLIASGIDLKSISTFSYMTDKRVYLEEDSDYSKFEAHCKANGINLVVRTSNGNACTEAAVRRYACYNPTLVGIWNTNAQVKERFSGIVYTIASKEKNHYLLRSENGTVCSIEPRHFDAITGVQEGLVHAE